MEERFEKKLKELLPYIIIIGVLFLLLPLFMGTKEGVATYLIQIGVFPLTAIGCCVHYKLVKKRNDIYICLIAPLFYALTALIYGMWRSSWVTVLIYLVAYLICGYLGLTVPDLLKLNQKKDPAAKPSRPSIKKRSQRPRRVDVEQDAHPKESFTAKDPEEDLSLDASTTDDDIETILNNIHNRKNS